MTVADAVEAVAGLGAAVAEALDVPDDVKRDRSRRADEDRARAAGKRKRRAGRRIRRTLGRLELREKLVRAEAADLGVTL